MRHSRAVSGLDRGSDFHLMRSPFNLLVLVVVCFSAVSCASVSTAPDEGWSATPESPSSEDAVPTVTARPSVNSTSSPSASALLVEDPDQPLAGRVVALDPGHNRGNFQHLAEINEPLFVGLWKTCNTTGTATDSGYLEADYNWDVVLRLKGLLEDAGATVFLTRDSNSDESWGPCIDKRARFGAKVGAEVMVSVHADGGPDSGYGHYVIAPGGKVGYSDDIAQQSRVLADSLLVGLEAVGLPKSTYASRSILISDDYGTLNLADVPTVIVETLNMRNASDAAIAESANGRSQVAEGLFAGIVDYFTRP